MNVKVKICGITRLEDAQVAIENGVDALGFIFYKKSKRYIEPNKVKEIIKNIPPFISKVGVFVNEDINDIKRIGKELKLDILQLHGEESVEYLKELEKGFTVVKAFRIKDIRELEKIKDYKIKWFLLDTYSSKEYGGTGEKFNWEIVKEAKKYGKVILAGGLNSENIKLAIDELKPYGVDISSGVEIDKGIKDRKKIIDIMRIIKDD
ncbi:phosphoribosylanthranilate isomerase [Haliovirga abyssi]|uniref:N-(5'-phosphoribosyl)anthranilate isomerase n=1 Tax=Haliovirga abyssi TaxID=2996794 RepID=A0AAU9E367_9FUSO|nr:phosphoribosylanthranilate isomerase [Haliovirga abyssi]BDU50880.1 N-(5'-phosphoribosyl)anthranilate isomerase [Haliovirga abyssi]